MNGEIKYPPKNPFLKNIWNRTHDYQKNWIQIVTGEPGAGKSYVTLALAERLDKRFSVDKVCFSLEQFFDALENIKYKGEVLIFDEMGITMSSRKWWSQTNQMINKVLQTFRYLNIITFFVVPDFSFIDAQARKIVQVFSEVHRRGRNPPMLKLMRLRHIRKDGDMHFVYPRIHTEHGRQIIRSIQNIPKPSDELVELYEQKMVEEKRKIAKADIERMKKERLEEVKKSRNINDDIQFILQNIDDFRNTRGKLDADVIRTKLNIAFNRSHQIKKMVELELNKTFTTDGSKK